MAGYFTIRWQDGKVYMIDQRKLPGEVVYQEYEDYQGVAGAIHDMVIRGAPAIGAAAAFGLALAATRAESMDLSTLHDTLKKAAKVLLASRPTAVNLSWAINRVMRRLGDPALDTISALQAAILAEAQAIAQEDVETNKRIGLHGLSVVPENAGIVHHCNTGALATVDYGTALGVIRTAHEHGRKIHVYVDETRPRLQGGRLTAWELQQLGVPHTVIVDGASGYFMRLGKIQLCLVGCDRIAANGDTANKIGTYNLALAAHVHKIPFYIVGPTTTIDFAIPDGDHIPIEERNAQEITHVGDCQITPDGVQVANPAFDVTSARFITGIITEKGIAYPPFSKKPGKISGLSLVYQMTGGYKVTQLSHVDDSGQVRMVDVGEKPDTQRSALACGEVRMLPETLTLIQQKAMKKGDVLSVAQIAGIMAAKRTAELIPLCHPLPLSQIQVDLELDESLPGIKISALVKTTGKTGVEMEALTAVSVAALTIYDMAKAVEKTMHIEGIHLVEKHGGLSGDIINK